MNATLSAFLVSALVLGIPMSSNALDFDSLDTNHDGMVSKEEFKRADTNKGGQPAETKHQAVANPEHGRAQYGGSDAASRSGTKSSSSGGSTGNSSSGGSTGNTTNSGGSAPGPMGNCSGNMPNMRR